MEQIFSPTWWFSFFGPAAPWWLFCVAASLVSLPLCLRLFRGLADKGSGLAIGVGPILTTFIAWVMSLGWFTAGGGGAAFRFALLVLAGGLFVLQILFRNRGYLSGPAAIGFLAAPILVGILAILPLPHGPFSAYLALLLIGAASLAAWISDLPRLRFRLRQAVVPFLLAQLLFLIGFLFFVNVRSYLPWAAFDLSLYQAEKWGNFTHLNSIMHSGWMPPKDIWFQGEPINYYYGGHLLVATIAKATGTPAEIAFNLGLATVFGLTLALGFSFILSLVHLTTRKIRLPLGSIWHSGMAWGLFGCLAIAAFGNLDPWRQLMTRDMDYGVKIRYVRAQEKKAEEWKLRNGIAPRRILQLVSLTGGMGPAGQPQGVLNELSRLEAELEDVPRELERMASETEERIEEVAGEPGERLSRQEQDSLYTLIFSGKNEKVLNDQNAANTIELQEDLFRLIVHDELEEIPERLRALAEGHRDPTPILEELESIIRQRMEAAMDSEGLASLENRVWDDEYESAINHVFNAQPSLVQLRLEQARSEESFAQVARLLADLSKAADQFTGQRNSQQAALLADLRRAQEAFQFNVNQIVLEYFDGELPEIRRNPTIDQIQFSPQNIAYVNFWDSSRIIKGTPPGVKEAGTITEFPYFSAILGDLHPHHMAIPYALLALSACLSFLRKNSRLKRGDFEFFRRSWPELLAMAFFIGAVFPVNIWDAVVLAPLYGLVIIIARKGVRPSDLWTWVGFAGFIVLLSLIVGLLYNSIPYVTPLFQNYKFFLLAVLILAAGIPAGPVFFSSRFRWLPATIASLLACLVILAAPFFAAGRGGPNPQPAFAIAFRDLLFFVILSGVSAMWTLPRASQTSNWWYSAGGVYALVGGLSLFFILPFKFFFQSPLLPEKTMFYDIMPPFLSWDLTLGASNFWRAFWMASPINPFPQGLRTDLRDFIVHWGVFLIPIVVLIAGRFFRAGRKQPPGFSFMVGMIAVAIAALARNYLGYWVGAFSLGFMVLSLYYAFAFRRRAEGPIWAFLAVAFFWTWFVEALHFDDDYGGNYERYNTPFKIYYPLWAIFAGGMVVSVRELLGRFRVRFRSPKEVLFSTELWLLIILGGIGVPMLLQQVLPEWMAQTWFILFMIATAAVVLSFIMYEEKKSGGRLIRALASGVSRIISHWPAAAAALVLLFVGLYYPYASTATRTRGFFTWPIADTPEARSTQRNLYMVRTLDALDHLKEFPRYRQDYKAMVWAQDNLDAEARILERAGENAYTHVGRMSTGTGLETIIGWKHHQHQWRGRAISAPVEMREWYYENIDTLTDLKGRFASIMGGPPKDFSPEEEQVLYDMSREERENILLAWYPASTDEQLGQMQEAIEQADRLPRLQPLLVRIVGEFEGRIEERTERALRLAEGDGRMEILRQIFPEATLTELYRMSDTIDRQSVSMNALMAKMLEDAQAMYTVTDLESAKELYGFYGIDYVIEGQLERVFFQEQTNGGADDLRARLEEWGFEEVYDSSSEESILPSERSVDQPTRIYRVPADFEYQPGGGQVP